jgi:hypothetical protein
MTETLNANAGRLLRFVGGCSRGVTWNVHYDFGKWFFGTG